MKSVLWLAALGLLSNATIWGLSWMPFRSLAEAGVHPLWATGIIYAVGTVAMAAAQPGQLRAVATTPGLLALALAGGLTNTAFNSAVAFGDVVRVVLLFYLMPVWAVLLARWLLAEPITRGAMARIALGLAGAMLVLYEPGIGWPLPRSLTDWLAIAGGALFALNNVLLRRLAATSESARAIAMLAGGMVCAGSLGALLSATGTIATPALGAAGVPMTLAIWSALFLIANLGLQYGAARLPANLTAVIMLSEVLVASGSAWWMGASELRVQDLLGGVMILLAPWLFTVRGAARAP
jgi:drug/metabolite transporter (DMT)-like permease